MSILNIGDEIDFKYYGTTRSGVIADLNDENIFVRIPSSQILTITKAEVLNDGQE